MPEEIELTSELAAFEAQLAATSLPPSSADRDTLFFHVGWAAAEAAGTKRRALGTARFVWPALSACLAAGLLIVTTLYVRSDRHERNIEEAAAPGALLSVDPTTPHATGATTTIPVGLLQRSGQE